MVGNLLDQITVAQAITTIVSLTGGLTAIMVWVNLFKGKKKSEGTNDSRIIDNINTILKTLDQLQKSNDSIQDAHKSLLTELSSTSSKLRETELVMSKELKYLIESVDELKDEVKEYSKKYMELSIIITEHSAELKSLKETTMSTSRRLERQESKIDQFTLNQANQSLRKRSGINDEPS